jgi:translation elongation factor P/translation initiation factor 5A
MQDVVRISKGSIIVIQDESYVVVKFILNQKGNKIKGLRLVRLGKVVSEK